MSVWLVRAGSHGEYEQKFLQESRVYLTWDALNTNLTKLASRGDLNKILLELFPDSKSKTITNWVSQIWPFANDIQKGDLVAIPLKSQRAIQFGEVVGEYQFLSDGPDPFFHYREVKWLGDPIPRDRFGQDLLHSFGAFMTICRIQRNNAEARIAAMRANGWKVETLASIVQPTGGKQVENAASAEPEGDLEEAGRDQIAKLISARFRGHHLTRLVEGILIAQGYTTYRSPEGSDGGADILAGLGTLGFGSPRLCVEVKSEATPIDRPTVDKLLGAMTKFGAQEGLFVSWSGFKGNVQKELAQSFFRLRLWSQKDLLEALFANYDRIDPDLRADLPLKRIWTVAQQDNE